MKKWKKRCREMAGAYYRLKRSGYLNIYADPDDCPSERAQAAHWEKQINETVALCRKEKTDV